MSKINDRPHKVDQSIQSDKINRVLVTISNAVNTTVDLDELYKYIHKSLSEVVNTTNFLVGLYHKNEDSITYPYYIDEKGDTYDKINNVSKSSIIAAEVIRRKEPFFINKSQVYQRLKKLNQDPVGEIPEQWLGVPLRIDNDVIGVIVVQSYHDPDLYSAKDAEILLTVSNQVALSIESKRKEKERQLSQSRIKTLYEISNAVNTTYNLDELYSSIHRSLGRIINVRNFYIALYSKRKDSLIFPYRIDEFDQNNPDEFLEIKGIEKSKSITARVILEGKPILKNNNQYEGLGTVAKTWLGVPLKVRDRIIGVMATQSYENPEEYSQEDVDIFSSVSDQVALAVDRKRKEQEALNNAHLAGMAEIATGTIHNVGNILNSIKVSSEIISDQMKTSSGFIGFEKVIQLLEDNKNNINEFIQTEKGISLIKYIHKLGNTFTESKIKIFEHLNRLSKGIDSIQEVITAQQSYTDYVPLKEYLGTRLIEDALTIQQGTIEKYNIQVIKEFDEIPRIFIQKTKLIHILINLIKNARDAMMNLRVDQRKLFLSLRCINDHIVLKVRDNGEGISKEHQTKVFSHGFTTKKNGKGFGLHSCANYMTEMGGKISAESDGPGKGATIVLEFPIKS